MRIKKGVQTLKRGFKTMAVTHKGKVAGKLAKKLRETRGVKVSTELKVQRKRRINRAKRILKKV